MHILTSEIYFVDNINLNIEVSENATNSSFFLSFHLAFQK
jgi:hypothetical protein